jgi:hypothetical protein
MSYVIYNKETTVLFRIRARSVGCFTDRWATEGACKATLTREEKKNPEFNRDDYAIAEAVEFHNNIEKTETKKNIFGKEFTQRVNTPLCCDPSSETYWSM